MTRLIAARGSLRRAAAGMTAAGRWAVLPSWAAVWLALVLVVPPGGGPAQAQLAPPHMVPNTFADLAEQLLPAVVNIATTQMREGRGGAEMPQFPPGSPFEDFFRDFLERQQESPNAPPRRATSLGSGFIVDPAGFVVTNYHVIEDADEIRVVLQNNRTLPAELVGRDDKTDIAVLRVQTDEPLPFLTWGDSDAIRVGDWVVAIGNPFGLGGSVTQGIISARARNIQSGPYDDFLQTDAAINRGNSGGPMFNLRGEVIGINTAIYSPTGGSVGIGFAIPSALSRPVVEQLIEFGRTRRGWIGVRIQTVSEEIAAGLGLESTTGALVASVTPGGPAELAGIEPGDVILRFNGLEVNEMRRLPRLVADAPVEALIDVEIWRDGELATLQVTLGELEEAEELGLLAALPPDGEVPDAPRTESLGALGITLSQLDDTLRREYGLLPGVDGVVITEVAPGSPAAEEGLAPGEVILEVGQEPVATPGDVARMVDQARQSGRRSVLLLVEREGDLRFVALSIVQG